MEFIFCFDICALVVLIFLLFVFLKRGLTHGRTNRVLIALLISCILGTCLNIFGNYSIKIIGLNERNKCLNLVLSYIFFIAKNTYIPLFVLYLFNTCGIIYAMNPKFWRPAIRIPYIISISIILLNIPTRYVFYFSENFEFSAQPGMLLLYVIAGFYLIFAFAVLLKYKHLIESEKFVAIITLFPIIILSAMVQAFIVQKLMTNLVVENFLIAFLFLIITSIIQRSDEVSNPVLNSQSFSSFSSELKIKLGCGIPSCIVFIKITNYAEIQKCLGQEKSNELLRSLIEKLRKASARHSLHPEICYMEYGVLALTMETNDLSRVKKYADDCYSLMNQKILEDGLEVEVPHRICILELPKDLKEFSSVLRFAYTFEKLIPDFRRAEFYSTYAKTKDFLLRANINAVIAQAIKNKSFEMYYQPIYSIKKRKFISAEALIRLNDDTYGFVPPSLFIPVAEETGEIHQIGDFVLEEVFSFINRNNFYEFGLEYIELNLSVAQCIESGILEKFEKLLLKYALNPNQVNLEITESASEFNPKIITNNIKLLSKAGFSFSLDDYGTGYSNIKRVVSLPLDIVKIDKCFVDAIDDPTMWLVTTNTIKMFQKIEKKVLVEGVETEEQYRKFEALGCDYIQGYYFSKPLPESEFLSFIREHNFNNRKQKN